MKAFGGERQQESAQGGGSRGSCSGEMTSKPVMSSSSQCQAVTRQRRRQRKMGKAGNREVTSPAVMSALEPGSRDCSFNQREGTRDEGRQREDSCKSYRQKDSSE